MFSLFHRLLLNINRSVSIVSSNNLGNAVSICTISEMKMAFISFNFQKGIRFLLFSKIEFLLLFYYVFLCHVCHVI